MPALQHDVVEGGGAALGLLHPEPVLHLVENLGIGHPRIGNSAKGYQLGQKDSETPHVRFDGKSRILSQ